MLGLAYAWSMFVGPIEDSMGWVRTQTSLVFTASMICFFAGNTLGGFLSMRFSLKKVFIASAVSFGVAFGICSVSTQVWQLCIFYGIFGGLTTGCSYMALQSNISKWFYDRMGFALGTMMMGFALGSFILGAGVNKLILQIGWRLTFRVMAAVYFAVLVLMAVLIAPPAADSQQGGRGPAVPAEQLARGYKPSEMLRTREFWTFFLTGSFTMAISVTVIGNIAVVAASLGASPAVCVLATGAVSIGNAICRVISGSLYDKKGRKFTLRLISWLALISSSLLEIAVIMKSLPLLFIAFLAVGANYGCISPIHSVVLRDYFGYRFHSVNYGINGLNGTISSVAGAMLAGVIQTNTGNYALSFAMLPFYGAIAFVLVHILKDPKDWHEQPLH